ncbi:MAG: DUF465 domain-containing protein [Caulobacterales bacterium]|nr:DUF465 domain-containing protein [Caulobacterales bacterium]MCA0372069.1 DUF465 domain-containing protein [Pseudomonadota bacterium]
MALQAHIRELSDKHSRLDAKIQKEMRNPSVDDIEITALKRQKLKLKEELEMLKAKH